MAIQVSPYISGSVYINIVSQWSSTEILKSIYNSIFLDKDIDSWVNTALLLVIHSGLTGLETSWALLSISACLRLLPSSAWLKLHLRVFGQANPNTRSYLINWPRCSLLGQPQLPFLWTLWTESDSLDGVHWILAEPTLNNYVHNSRLSLEELSLTLHTGLSTAHMTQHRRCRVQLSIQTSPQLSDSA